MTDSKNRSKSAITPAAQLYRYRFANAEYNESTNILRVAGREVAVERLPLNVLAELLHRPDQVVTRNELFKAIWDNRDTVEHVLANAVSKLRKALGEEAEARIVNVPRVGYRFSGPLERVAAGRQHASPVDLKAGQRVPGRDDFLLQRPLGATHKSTVWLARDPKLQLDRVFKFATDGEELSSLKREYTVYRVLRQELGERQDFARVFGANFSNAPFFLECEYGGVDLRAWAAEGDRLNALSIKERLELFLRIARAVAAAHGVGVLHKDLKPANVLIASNGDGWLARLTDFGNSRLLEPGRLAQLGVTAMGLPMTQGVDSDSFGGTPLYLAPELLAGESPTTQSDLFALGLILYQMLTGNFRQAMATGWQRDISDELLVEDLTAATEGDPAVRLGSVAELVTRLTSLETRRAARLAAKTAAMAAEAAAAELARRRTRRPWVVGFVASLTVGLAASVWFAARATAALQRAEQESARATAIADFLNSDVLQSPDLHRTGAKKTISLLDVLRRASANASARFKGQPRTEAAVRYQLAQIFLRMASTTDADAEYQAALRLLEPEAAASDPLLLAIRFTYASAGACTDRPNERRLAVRQLEEAERDAGPAVVNGSNDVAFLATKARFDVLFCGQDNQAALPVGLRMLDLADSVPTVASSLRFAARQSVAELYFQLGQDDHANELMKPLLSAPDAPENMGEMTYARAKFRLAENYRKQGKLPEAADLLVTVRDRLLHSIGPNDLQLGWAESELATVYSMQGRPPEVERAMSAALVAFTASLGDQHQYVNVATVNLAASVLAQGRAAEALQLLDRVTPWFETHTTRRFLPLCQHRVAALNQLHRYSEALAEIATLSAKDFEGESEHQNMRWFFEAERGHALLGIGRKDEGRSVLRAALAQGAAAFASAADMAPYAKLLDTPAARRSR